MTLVVKDWKDSPDTTTPLSAAALEDLETRLGAYTDRFAVGYQTSLPGSPADGDVIAYAADATNGVIWNLRYRSGASGSYKWEFIGGSPMFAAQTGTGTTTSATFTDLGAGGTGPTVTVPLAGDYWVSMQAELVNTNASAANVMSFSVGGTAAAEADRALTIIGTASEQYTITGTRLKTAIAASSAITMKYRTTGGTMSGIDRILTVIPVRVG